MFLTHLTTVATLALSAAFAMTTAAEPATTTPDRVPVSAHHAHHHETAFVGPKGGDTRKGVYAVPDRLIGAVVRLTYPDHRAGFIGPKGGDTRKGVPLAGLQLAGAVIPLIYHDTDAVIGPKGGEVRKGVFGAHRGGATIPYTH